MKRIVDLEELKGKVIESANWSYCGNGLLIKLEGGSYFHLVAKNDEYEEGSPYINFKSDIELFVMEHEGLISEEDAEIIREERRKENIAIQLEQYEFLKAKLGK